MRWLGALLTLFLAAPVYAETCYFGQWEWFQESEDFSYWRAPGGNNTASLDLRSLPQMRPAGGTPEGYGVFCYATTNSNPLLVDELFTDIDAPVPNNVRNRLRQNLGLATINGVTWRDVWWDIMTLQADPTGETRWKPLRPGHDGIARLRFGSFGLVHQAKITPESKEWPIMLAAIQEDYRELSEKETNVLTAKWLDYQEEKYGLPYWTFIPNDAAIRIASLPHETTIGDTFVEGGPSNPDLNTHTATGANGGFSWTAISGTIFVLEASDEAIGDTSGSNMRYRAESSLSGADMYTQFDATAWSSTTTVNQGPIVSFNSSADSFYVLLLRDRADEQYRLFKWATGTPSQVGSSVTESLPSVPVTVKLENDGGVLTGYMAGVSKISETDTSYTTHVRAGILLGPGTTRSKCDNFEAADLAAAAARRIILVQ